MSRPILRVSRPTFKSAMNWTASASTAWNDREIDGILDAAWEALDIDGLDFEIVGDIAPRSAWVVGGDDGEIDATLLRGWDAAVDAALAGIEEACDLPEDEDEDEDGKTDSEARTLAGMEGGYRALAEFDGLELDDDTGVYIDEEGFTEYR